MDDHLRQARADRMFLACLTAFGCLLVIAGILATSKSLFFIGLAVAAVAGFWTLFLHKLINEGPEE